MAQTVDEAKKSTDSKPIGLPSVALAKDGGRSRTRIYDLHDVNVIGFVDYQRVAKQNSVKLRKLRNLMALSVRLYAVVAPC